MAKMKYTQGNKSAGGSMRGGDADSGSMGSNKGASTGLKKSNDMRADMTKQPSNKNPYPNGLA